MARPGLTQHRKFLRLARLLGSAPLALGCLELMWEKCYQNGDPYLGDEIDVEAAAQWPGANGELCRALLDAGGDGHSGFIEEVEGRLGRYQCHDLFDHAPRYVGKRLQKEIARQAQGKTLSELRAEAGRKGGSSSKRAASEQQTDSKRTAKFVPPAPAPAPAPLTTSCTESAEAASMPAVFHLPCVGSGPKSWPVTEEMLEKWGQAFPGVDLMSQLRRMQLWLEDPKNASRRKTHRGMGQFVTRWLGNEQDKAPARASPGRVTPLRPDLTNQGPSSFPSLSRVGTP